MTKFDILYNSLINEDENVYMPGTKNTHSTREEIIRQIKQYVKDLQSGDNFDQTVQDVLETAVMLVRGGKLEHCLVMFSTFKKSLPQDVFNQLLTVAIEGNIDERLKSEFKSLVLPKMREAFKRG